LEDCARRGIGGNHRDGDGNDKCGGSPGGEQPEIEAWSAVVDTYAGRVHVERDATAPVTPFGQLPFFIEYLKQGGLFDGWVADCPLSLTSPNAPRQRYLLGTVLLSVRPKVGIVPVSKKPILVTLVDWPARFVALPVVSDNLQAQQVSSVPRPLPYVLETLLPFP
jgi:hypothetical protein